MEKMCCVPNINSHEIPAVGVKIQPKDCITLQVNALICRPIASKFKSSEGNRPSVLDMNSHENLCSWNQDIAINLYFHETCQ